MTFFFDEAEAEEHGLYMCSCYVSGMETLSLSNPGDYPLGNEYDVDYEITEIDD